MNGLTKVEIKISIGAGQIGVLTVIMVFTEILAAFITSKAAALVMFPIAVGVVLRRGD